MFLTLAQGVNILYGFTGYLPFGYVGFFGAGAYGFSIAGDAPDRRRRSRHSSRPAPPPVALGLLLDAAAQTIRRILLDRQSRGIARRACRSFPTQTSKILRAVPTASASAECSIRRSPMPWRSSILAATLLFVAYLRSSNFGLALQAIREDLFSASMAGIDVVRARMIAWLACALVAGFVGGVFAWYVSVFFPETVFGAEFSIFAIVFALFGGTSTLLGPDRRRRHSLRRLQPDRRLDAAIFSADLRLSHHGARPVPAEWTNVIAAATGDRCPLIMRRFSRSPISSSASAAFARSTD